MQFRVANSPAQFLFLAQLRYQEAIALLRSKHWRGSLYLEGYVFECALKAVMAKRKGNRGGGETPSKRVLASTDLEIADGRENKTAKDDPAE